MTRSDIVLRARNLVGTRFRPQGRSAEDGLDCIGLALAAYRIEAGSVRTDYRLRDGCGPELVREIGRFFTASNRAFEGDLLLCAVAGRQWHLAVHCGHSFVHADAAVRKVVETPGAPKWPVAGIFRHRSIREEESWRH